MSSSFPMWYRHLLWEKDKKKKLSSGVTNINNNNNNSKWGNMKNIGIGFPLMTESETQESFLPWKEKRDEKFFFSSHLTFSSILLTLTSQPIKNNWFFFYPVKSLHLCFFFILLSAVNKKRKYFFLLNSIWYTRREQELWTHICSYATILRRHHHSFNRISLFVNKFQ